MTLRVLVFSSFLTEVPYQTSCPALPLQTAQANHYLRRCCFRHLCLSAHNSCSVTPHVQNDIPFALCSLCFSALLRLVDDCELGDVSVSLFAVQLRCTCVHLCTFLLDTEEVIFQSLFCEELVK